MEKPIVFISHISDEKKVAECLQQFIIKEFLNGISVFVSSDYDSIKLGDGWFDNIGVALKKCKLEIVICSPYSTSKPWINFESGAGFVRGVPVIPMCHSGLTPENLPFPLKLLQGGCLNNKDDVERLFMRIAEINDNSVPEIHSNEYFTAIKKFENEIQTSSLITDYTTIKNLMCTHIDMLKNIIMISVTEVNTDLSMINFEELNIEFSKMVRLLELTPIYGYYNKRIFEVFYETLNQVAEDIKFIFISSYIMLTDELKKIFNEYISHIYENDCWYKPISMEYELYKGEVTEMVKSFDKFPPYSHFMSYFAALNKYKKWIINYEKTVNTVLNKQ